MRQGKNLTVAALTGIIFLAAMGTSVPASAADAGQRLRLQEPLSTFDLTMSSVVGPWMLEAGYTSMTANDIAFAFRLGNGRSETLDVMTQGRILAMRAIGLLAYYAPDEAKRLLNRFSSFTPPALYAPNMFTYGVDVAAVELEQLFIQEFTLNASAELRTFIVRLFRAGFMQRPLAEIQKSLQAILSQSTANDSSNSGYNYTFNYINQQIDKELANMPAFSVRKYTDATSKGNFNLVTSQPAKLQVDFSKLECYRHDFTDNSSRREAGLYNQGQSTYYSVVYGDNGSSFELVLDGRNDKSNYSDMDPGFVVSLGQDALYSMRYVFRNHSIDYPLPPVNTPGDTVLSATGNNSSWRINVCVEQQGGADVWKIRYLLVKVRDDLSLADGQTNVAATANEERDYTLREVLKEINASYWELLQERANKLNLHILEVQPLREGIAEKELTTELIDRLFRYQLNPTDTTLWRYVHAKRSKDAQDTGIQNFNAIGYELDVDVLHRTVKR